MKHTPLPWFVGSWEGSCHIESHGMHHPGPPECKYDYELCQGEYFSRFISAGSKDNPITIIGADEDGAILSEVDAEFIVKAVNSYKEEK